MPHQNRISISGDQRKMETENVIIGQSYDQKHACNTADNMPLLFYNKYKRVHCCKLIVITVSFVIRYDKNSVLDISVSMVYLSRIGSALIATTSSIKFLIKVFCWEQINTCIGILSFVFKCLLDHRILDRSSAKMMCNTCKTKLTV